MSAAALFDEGFDAQRVLMGLSLATRQEIKPGSTLIVLDEIQTNPRAITALKYFCEELPAYAVAAAGSLLGLSAHEGSGYPVGKVETLNLHPLSFREYLDATGDRPLRLLLDSQDTQTMAAFSEREVLALKTYYLVGGMPAVVNEYVENEDFAQVRALQNQILEDYTRDFAKHMPMRLLPKALDAWHSIPAHLSHENKKFVFGRIREGARAKDFEDALIWLQQAGLISMVPRVKKPALPLSAYDGHKAFKVFLFDIGLLGAMSGVDAASIVQGSGIFTEFKGALTEQYVCQQLISDCGVEPYYWSAESSTGEIDFLAQDQGAVYAMEVKAEENLRAKSLRAFKQENPQVKAVRFSLSPYRQQDWMRNVPLYAIANKGLWG